MANTSITTTDDRLDETAWKKIIYTASAESVEGEGHHFQFCRRCFQRAIDIQIALLPVSVRQRARELSDEYLTHY